MAHLSLLWQSDAMPPKEQPLAVRLQTDDCLRDTVRLVGYLGLKTPISEADYKRLIEKHGRERLGKASEELVDIDQKKKLATLKADVRKRCQSILGPAPEDWENYYEGIENPPPNPYLKKKRTRKKTVEPVAEIDLVAGAVADAIREQTGMDVTVSKPFEHAGHIDFTKQTDKRLQELLEMNLRELETEDRDTVTYEEALRDVKLIEAERRRRGMLDDVDEAA
jgi:hypothetical protein